MTNLELFNIMRQIVLNVTGVPEVILANPNAPSPLGEYASIKPKQSIAQRGQANIHRKTSSTPLSQDEEVRAQIIAECSINFYRGASSRDRVERLLQCNKRSDISGLLFTNGLGWNRAGPINDLDFLQSNNWEQRAQISVFVMYETRDEITINSIESSSYIIEYEDGTIIDATSTGDYLIPLTIEERLTIYQGVPTT